jgi:hypothetical protein
MTTLAIYTVLTGDKEPLATSKPQGLPHKKVRINKVEDTSNAQIKQNSKLY